MVFDDVLLANIGDKLFWEIMFGKPCAKAKRIVILGARVKE